MGFFLIFDCDSRIECLLIFRRMHSIDSWLALVIAVACVCFDYNSLRNVSLLGADVAVIVAVNAKLF